LSDARLQAVLSRKTNSEHGFDARIGPASGQVCHSLMVVPKWRPGSAHCQAASAIRRQRSRAGIVLLTWLGSVRQRRCQSSPRSTAAMKSLVTLTELLEFWPETVA
jgi:hypothetical protein